MSRPENNENFLEVIEENKGIIHKISNAYCPNHEDRIDLVQEIIIQIWKSLHKYNNHYKISTWIYQVALNVAISNYRKYKVRKNRIIPLTDYSLNIIEDSQAQYNEGEIGLLYQFIHELKELDKALMILYLEDKSYQEIAEILDISKTNVATKIGRIKLKLKQKFLAQKNNDYGRK